MASNVLAQSALTSRLACPSELKGCTRSAPTLSRPVCSPVAITLSGRKNEKKPYTQADLRNDALKQEKAFTKKCTLKTETSHVRHLRKMRDMWVAVGHRVQRKGKESSFFIIDEE
eukprot:CAMPEP_0198207188 /NCGR_PEP_ID=MMETSP1445-20131203/10672_1 /TAXON_ID=36898 /ORGANISM="Pyramimonas sp., Strain CCMP2087" /LENGTH=114 /DNA_ID=CAMNT_0043880149 /DNA_START=193 /DNA_END=540 /DNA_ORIENTATION=+